MRRQSDLKFLDETSRKELATSPAELVQAHGTAPDEVAVAEAEQRVEEIRRRIESLGPVNPEALNEYQEAQQRYDFLNTQRQDLLDSIRDTEKAIQEIDVESQASASRKRSTRSTRTSSRCSDSVRRRTGRDAADRRKRLARPGHRNGGSAAGQATPERPAAVRRREGADGRRRC